LIIALWFGLSWLVALIAGFALFGPARCESGWRIAYWLVFIAAVSTYAFGFIESFEHPSHGHMEYSEHTSEWVDDDGFN
jgi:hypothetical protein